VDQTRIHLFHCVHGGECITTHDVVQDSFISIAKDVGFHVLHEQTHVLSMSFLQSSRQQMDIILIIDGICTLANKIITNPICANLVLQATSSQGVASMITTQAKIVSYYS